MKRLALAALMFAAVLPAQQFKFNLDGVGAKASDSVDLSLSGPMLQFAAKFLDGKDPDEAKVKKLIGGLEGIYIKRFEFKKGGGYADVDLEGIRSQLKAPAWSKMVGYKSSTDGENAEIYMRMEASKIAGIAILCAAPKELTVVNIVGPIDLDSLAELGGHLGLPKLQKK
ncbi:MAG TPA: DUF4252 domain-containing protein [Candidatus Limnocylindrales bacterium]|jgi:hypothetical protein|nr:DUF4252 domain-containing protein [Candidatus Limnocylindrales bacterium]